MAITQLTPEQIKNDEFLSLTKSGHCFMWSVGDEYPRSYHAGSYVFIVDSREDEIGPDWERIRELLKDDIRRFDDFSNPRI